MLQDTIIIFSSDNGAAINGPWSTSGSNYPLRGEKNSNYEGGIRVPGFVWSPRLKNMPRVSNEMMHIVDWLPTIYHAAGGDVKDLGQIDGMDMWPTIAEEQPSPRTGFLINVDSVDSSSGYRDGDWKLIRMNSSHNPNGWDGPTGMSVGPFAYPQTSTVLNVLRRFYNNPSLRYRGGTQKPLDCGSGKQPNVTKFTCADDSLCLFNIANDPCEYNDLSKQFPEKVTELQQKIQAIQTVPPQNSPSDFKSAPMFHCGYWDSWLDEAHRKSVEFCHQ